MTGSTEPARMVPCTVCEEYQPVTAMHWIVEDGLTLVGDVGRWGRTAAYETRPDDPAGVPYCPRCALYLGA